jgi:hypothetical protein
MQLAVVFLPIAIVIAIAIVVGAGALREYAETGSCYKTRSTLTADELHVRTVHSLLAVWSETSLRMNVGKFRYQTFLIAKDLTPKELIDVIASKSIVNLPQDAAYSLQSSREIVNIDPNFLRSGFSLVRYSIRGEVEIVPSHSLKAIDTNAARNYLDIKRKKGFHFSFLERVQGYGNHYFQMDMYHPIDLGCCDEIYSKYPKLGKSQESYAQETIKAIRAGKQLSRHVLVVSNCGDIMQRNVEGDELYLF